MNRQQHRHFTALLLLVAAFALVALLAQRHVCSRLAHTQAAALAAYADVLRAQSSLPPLPAELPPLAPLPPQPSAAALTAAGTALAQLETAAPQALLAPAWKRLRVAIDAYNTSAWKHNIEIRKYPDALLPPRFTRTLPYFPAATPSSRP